MKRSDFLKGLAAMMAVPFIPNISLAEPAFNQKKLQDRIDQLRKYPLSERECFQHNGKTFWYEKGISDTAERFVINSELGLLIR